MLLNGEMFEVYERFDFFSDGVNEIVAELLYVECDKIGAEHSIEQLSTPWTDTERFRTRPWHVPEDADRRFRTSLFYHAWQECEVIVLYENDGPLDMPDFLEQDLRELTVHFTVLEPVFFSELRPDMGHETERIQPLDDESLVVSADFIIIEPYSLECIFRLVGRNSQFPLAVCRLFV